MKKFYRVRDNKVFFGVCEGLGHHTNVDPLIWRLLFFFLIFTPARVIVDVAVAPDPAPTAVTKPVDETVATNPFEEVQGFVVAGDAEPDNCDVALTHADKVPDIVGKAKTVNIAVT